MLAESVDIDVATRICFYRIAPLSQEGRRLFAIVSFEKSCSHQFIVPNTDAYLKAYFFNVGNSSSRM